MKPWLQNKSIEIQSTQTEEKSVVADRFIRTFKNLNLQIYDCNIKNVYIDKLDDIVQYQWRK